MLLFVIHCNMTKGIFIKVVSKTPMEKTVALCCLNYGAIYFIWQIEFNTIPRCEIPPYSRHEVKYGEPAYFFMYAKYCYVTIPLTLMHKI